MSENRKFNHHSYILYLDISPMGYADYFLNGSMVKFNDKLIFSCRFHENRHLFPCKTKISEIDKDFKIINNTVEEIKAENMLRFEDARLFVHDNALYICFTDNHQMFLSALGNDLKTLWTKKLFYSRHTSQEKNWLPFSFNNKIYFIYRSSPIHQILEPFQENDKQIDYRLAFQSNGINNWRLYGEPRGGTPPFLHNGKYYSFFHSSNRMLIRKNIKEVKKIKLYYAGVYTFSPAPPFNVLGVSYEPVISGDINQITSVFGPEVSVHFPGGAYFDYNLKKWFVMNGEADTKVCLTTYEDNEIEKLITNYRRMRK